jgi:hypothetical protein
VTQASGNILQAPSDRTHLQSPHIWRWGAWDILSPSRWQEIPTRTCWEGRGTENITAYCRGGGGGGTDRGWWEACSPHSPASDVLGTLSLIRVPGKGGRFEVCGFWGLYRYRLGTVGVGLALLLAMGQLIYEPLVPYPLFGI